MTGVTGATGGDNSLTLTRLVPNGARVSKDDVIAEYDRLNLLDQERDAVALEESLKHQVSQKKAEVLSLQATRASLIREAQADLERAQLQLRKGPVLSEIDRLKNQAKAENAAERLVSLKKSDESRIKSEDASVKILELKLARQQVTLERLRNNLSKLIVKAPQDGMVSHEITWRMGNMGPPQVGDRMYPGMPLVRIFNPTEMVVQATVDEPDFAAISSSKTARVYLDAYSGEMFTATLQSATPVATGGIDTPVRNFTVIFHLDSQSPRLLPDLSAALEIDRPGRGATVEPKDIADAKPSAKVNP